VGYQVKVMPMIDDCIGGFGCVNELWDMALWAA